MRLTLLDLLYCPRCQSGSLQLIQGNEEGSEIWSGELACEHCQATFAICEGMPHLYVEDERWLPKAREAAGWVALHQELGHYEQYADAPDFQAPYIAEGPWPEVARSFDMALEQLALTGEEVVLDLGAGRGWAAKQFALHGCRVVALDVVADQNVGLGRGKALMDEAGTYFERVVGDAENLPLRPGSFDLVFACGSLHHFSDLPLLMANIARILKPGGRLCAINEPCVNILADEQQMLAEVAADELRHGINENRPDITDYFAALTGNSFEIELAMPKVAYGMDEAALLQWGRNLGAIRPAFSWRAIRPVLRQARTFLHRQRAAWRSGRLAKTRPPAFLGRRGRHFYQILLWIDAELFLLATTATTATTRK